MTSDDFASMMRYREELITGKIQELTEGLSQVVGIPDDQLANLDLNVTESDDGVPVRELVTMDAPESIDEELKTAVKGSKGSGGFEYQRRGLYEFLAQRDSIDLDDEGEQKIEFLVRANLRHYLHGAYWLAHYEGDMDDLIEIIIAEDIDGKAISSVERILLILGKKEYLEQINDDYGSRFKTSNAASYTDICNRSIHHRVKEYADRTVKVNDTFYSVRKLVYGNEDVELEDLFDEVIGNLLSHDDSTGRIRLRKLELIYLAVNS